MKKQIIFTLMIFGVLFLRSQDKDQVTGFINKSHIALNKTEKEIMQLSDKNLEVSFKEAIKYQMASVKYYKANKLNEAYEFSFRSRMICIEILSGINKLYSDFFNPTDTEKQLMSSDYKTLVLNADVLNPAESAKVDNLNITEPQKLRELEINLN
ncbi:MAG TPA: hypothetical protein VN026_13645 [Bacteroidia bacterium]|jgi:hypothetical protein|nr:hypothetical protein [Bacteroidia bacterium]